MATKISLRRGLAAQWVTSNTLLAAGEPGYETDTKKFKIGDGLNRWNALPYFLPQNLLEAYIAQLIADAIADLDVGVIDDLVLSSESTYSSSKITNLFNSLLNNSGTSNASTWTSARVKEYVDAEIAKVIGGAASDRDTLKELSDLILNTPPASWNTLADRPNFIAAGSTPTEARAVIDVPSTSEVNTALDGKVDKSGYSFDLAQKADLSGGKVPVAQLPDVTQYANFTEAVQDVTGNLIKAGSNVTVQYDDAAGTFTINSVGGSGGSGTDPEEVRDTIAGALIAGTGMQITVDDTANTITLAVSGLNINMISGLQAALNLKAPLDSPAFTGTPTGITKAHVGLSNVDNTSDVNKPVSGPQQTALDLKAPLANPSFSGTVTGVTKAHVGLGNVDNTSDAAKPVSSAQQTALDAKAPLASPAFTGTPTGISKAHVGLGNVDNTSDANKPVSTAQQLALNAKVDISTYNAEKPSKADLVSGKIPVGQIPDLTSDKILDFAEAAQDALAVALQGGTGISLSYNDAANSLTISNTGGSGGLDAEAVRDAIGVALIGSGYISVVVNDAADTITITQSQALIDALAAKAADSSVVHLSGSETITGAKTFSVLPTGPTTAPTLANQFAVKQYVDTKVSKNSLVRNVVDYGADPTGANKAATKTAYINAMADSLEGGTILTPEGIFDWDGEVPLTAAKIRLTFTGPGMIRGRFGAGDGTARLEGEFRFIQGRYYRPLDFTAYATKGYADDSFFIGVDRVRRIIIEDNEFYGAAMPVMVKANANAASHDISMLRIKNNFFNECDYAVDGNITSGVTYEAIADSQIIGNIVNKSYVGGFVFDGVDGIHIAHNVFFMQNFNNTGGRFAEKLNNIWLKAATWCHIDNNNLFEAGMESIKIDAAKNYKITDNLIAWAGQRAMADSIFVGSYSTAYGSGEWASGVIAGNLIQFYTKSAIKVTGNHYELSLGLNSVRYNSGAASYKGTPALTTANHYRYDLSGLTGMKMGDVDMAGSILARDGHYDSFPGHGYVRWFERTELFGMNSASFRALTFTAGQAVAGFGIKDAQDSSSTWSGRVLMTVGVDLTSAGKKTTYDLFLSKTPAGVKVTQYIAHGYEDGLLADDPSFTFSLNASNQLVATAVGVTAGTFNFSLQASGNIILG